MGGLGFRETEVFNLALLARQAWRILIDPEALSSRILKAAYFHDRDFLEAEVGSSPSQVWLAIMEGKEVLEQGLIRRIGSGSTTDIWCDNWLPRDGLMKPIRTDTENPPQKVYELIDHTSASWNNNILSEFFSPMDIEVIQNIPLCTSNREDF